MAANGPQWNAGIYRMPQSDQIQEQLNGFRGSNLGTTTATVTIPCPKVTTQNTGLALTDLYASGTGTAKVSVSSGSTVIWEANLQTYPVNVAFNTPLCTEPGQSLTVTVTGATEQAGVAVSGFVVGRV